LIKTEMLKLSVIFLVLCPGASSLKLQDSPNTEDQKVEAIRRSGEDAVELELSLEEDGNDRAKKKWQKKVDEMKKDVENAKQKLQDGKNEKKSACDDKKSSKKWLDKWSSERKECNQNLDDEKELCDRNKYCCITCSAYASSSLEELSLEGGKDPEIDALQKEFKTLKREKTKNLSDAKKQEKQTARCLEQAGEFGKQLAEVLREKTACEGEREECAEKADCAVTFVGYCPTLPGCNR